MDIIMMTVIVLNVIMAEYRHNKCHYPEYCDAFSDLLAPIFDASDLKLENLLGSAFPVNPEETGSSRLKTAIDSIIPETLHRPKAEYELVMEKEQPKLIFEIALTFEPVGLERSC
jgi:hypothetical protein